MQLTDSHCHLDSLDLTTYQGDIRQAINAARTAGVKYILSAGTTLEEFPTILDIIGDDPDLFATVGVHPTETQGRYPSREELLNFGNNPRVIGIGETGLDLLNTHDMEVFTYQRDLFKLHLEVAKELAKPVVIHARNADRELLQILREEQDQRLTGVLHCFTGDSETALAAIELGYYVSVSGIVTFKKAEALRAMVKILPRDRLLIETDAPYLAPVPLRGKPNEPAYLPHTAQMLADLLQLPLEELADITTNNFLRLYRL